MTSGPAKAIHRETTLGSIGVGREADVTVLKVVTSLSLFLFSLSSMLPLLTFHLISGDRFRPQDLSSRIELAKYWI